MTANDLAEACLTDHEFFKKEDYVEFILRRLRDNQVIEYPSKDRGAFFRMSAVEAPNPVQILARIQRTQVQDPEAKQHWGTLLTASAPQAGGLKMLFQGAEVDRPQRARPALTRSGMMGSGWSSTDGAWWGGIQL